jgi:acetyltransferase
MPNESPSSTHYLSPLFTPRSVAIIGASEREGALGRYVFENVMRAGFRGTVYPVNPKYRSVLGVRAFPSIDALPEAPDLVVVATPAGTVADILHDAGVRGTRAAVVLSAGFAEAGSEGRARAERVAAELTRYGIRMLGPNCVGLMRPALGLNATFANAGAKPGPLALIAQSGAVCTAILDWAATTEIGFSSVISLGGAQDVDFGEALDFLVHDVDTRAILLYIEGVRDARRFLSALRAASRVKPVVVYKAGRYQSGATAATSHTGALAGRDDVWDAALARAGVVRVESSLQLFAAARLLAEPQIARVLKGNRLAIITNGGGPGVVAADAVQAAHLSLATLSTDTVRRLNAVLPPHWSHANPVDIIGDATPARFEETLRAVLDDAAVDAVLVLFCPQAVTTAEAAARAVIPVAQDALKRLAKPVFTAWLGGASIGAARALFEKSGVANFLTPENAVEAFSNLARFREHQAELIQAVSASEAMRFHERAQAIARANRIREAAASEGRTLLSEQEVKAIVAAFGVPVAEGVLSTSAGDAAEVAAEMGFPVVLKVDAKGLTHKSDIGGVRLNLSTRRQVMSAFDDIVARAEEAGLQINGINVQPMLHFAHQREVMIGFSHDATFGPVVAFSAGGVAVEQLQDVALALPPLNFALAHALIQRTRMARVLTAYRNIPAVELDALAHLIVRVSTIATALPWVRELDLNPVLAHPGGVAVVDARMVVDHTQPVTDTRYRHMAIFPYPVELEREFRLKDGTAVQIRPIRPDDAARERAFVAAMSDTSRYYRFLHPLAALSDEMIARFTQLDYAREMALVATAPEESVMVGVARYFPNADGRSVEFAIAVADAWQGKGLGRALMQDLIATARDAGFAMIEGSILRSNVGMLNLATQLGFATRATGESAHDVVRVELVLQQARETPS